MRKAIQMWSFRDRIKDGESLLEALKIAADIGYEGIEFAGTFGVPANEMKEALKKLGLVSVSCHEGVDRMEKDIDEIIAYHHELGTPFIGCSYSPTATKEDLERLERVMKIAQEKAAPYGIKVVYHNHAHEFQPLDDGVRPIDEIAKWCLLEPDTYWVFHAGDNPCEFLRRYRSQVGLIHLKDGVDGKGTSIGDGANDLQSIVDTARDMNIEWVIAEIENEAEDAESVRDAKNSYAYMTETLGM